MNIRIKTLAAAALLAATLPAMVAAAPRGGGGTHGGPRMSMGAPGGSHGRPGRDIGPGRDFGYPGEYGYPGYPGYYAYPAFSGFNGIEGWVADSDDTVYLEATGGNWYEVELARPCFGLSNAPRIGIDNGPMRPIDNVSNVIVNGERCPVVAVNRVAGPPRRDRDRVRG